MEKKLVFLDVDGTLLPPGEMQVPQSALDALHKARANGHKMFLCTGRNLGLTKPLLRHGFDGYICSAGGYVVCGDEVLVNIPMEPAQVDGLRKVMGEHGIECTLETREDTYGGVKMIERFASHLPSDGTANSEAERWKKMMEFGMTIRPIEDYNGDPVYKIVYIAGSMDDLAEPKRQYEDQFVFCENNVNPRAGVVNGELINRKFNKGTGIKAICAHLGVPLRDTIGFGDSDNDLQMTDVVGISYCMANGTDSLKKLCDRVCPSVKEDGIAKAFAELGLI